jgi:hypothetical protein
MAITFHWTVSYFDRPMMNMTWRKNLILVMMLSMAGIGLWLVYFFVLSEPTTNIIRTVKPAVPLRATRRIVPLGQNSTNGKQCRTSRDFVKNPIVLAGLNSIKGYYSDGKLQCSNVPCQWEFASDLQKANNLHLADAFLAYGTTPNEVDPFITCRNQQQKVFYFWEAWKPYDASQTEANFWGNWDVIIAPYLHADLYVSYNGHNIMQPFTPRKYEKSLASSFISNCDTQVKSGRNQFVLSLLTELGKQGYWMDLYGKCFGGYNKPIPKELSDKYGGNRDGQKIDLMRRYKFNLALENNADDGYLSEKFYQALQEGTVPIVLGTQNVKSFAPLPDAIIVASDFKTTTELATEMIRLANNDEAYAKYLRYKNIPPWELPHDHLSTRMYIKHSYYCRACARVADAINPQLEIDPMVDGVRYIKIRPTFEHYFEMIPVPKSFVQLKAAIITKFHLHHDKSIITRIYPSRVRWVHDIWFSKDIGIDSDEKVAAMKHGEQFDFVYANV